MPKEITALQIKYDKIIIKNEHLALDLKKAKIDAQEEGLKYDKKIFRFQQELARIKSELDKLKNKTTFPPLDPSDYEKISQKINEMENDLKPRDIEPLSSDPKLE